MIRAHIEPDSQASSAIISTAPSPTQQRGEESGRGVSDLRIEQTIAFMREHLNQSLPVAQLAALANMSPSYYTALFKRRTGCAPIDYFIRLRMRHACDLLIATSLNVKEVAAALGYEDPFYFSRVFKSVNQVAPSDYRALHKGRNHGETDSPFKSCGGGGIG